MTLGRGLSRRPRTDIRPSAAASGNPEQPSRGTRLARAVTEVLAPTNVAAAQVLLVSWDSAPGLAGLAWGLLTATFCGLLPAGIVLVGVRRHQWTDRHLRTRQQRPVPLLAGIASFLVGLGMLVVLDAPRQLTALMVAMLTGLAATLVVNLWWKLSIHTAAASGTVAILILTYGSALTLAIPAVAVVAWSRVRLGDHTPPQTVAGALLGGLVATIFFIALR